MKSLNKYLIISIGILLFMSIGLVLYFYSDKSGFVYNESNILEAVPLPGSSVNEIRAYTLFAQSIAVKGNSINVRDCVFDPKVLEIGAGSLLKILNSNDEAIGISFGSDTVSYIDPGVEAEFDVIEYQVPGFYTVGCKIQENDFVTGGLLMITTNEQ